ncbi:MAG: hypothetical protein HPY71_15050 [Firmicutes bacterium]|nr:hypothetical protein [Bacillota bacterium]
MLFSRRRTVRLEDYCLLCLCLIVAVIFLASPVYALELISPSEMEGEPGAFITHVFKVLNDSDREEVCDVRGGSENGWDTIGLTASVKLSPGKRTLIPVTVHIPDSAPAGTEDVLELVLLPRSSPGLELRGRTITKVALVSKVALALPEGKSGERGTAVIYAVTAENRGNGQDEFEVTVSSLLGWKAEVSPSRISLSPLQNGAVYIKHFIPKNAPIGSTDRLTIVVKSVNRPEVSAQGLIATTVAGSVVPSMPDEKLFYVLPGEVTVNIPPSLFSGKLEEFGPSLRLSGPLSENLRLSVDMTGLLVSKTGSPMILPNYLQLTGDTWKASWGSLPGAPLSWMARPEYPKGIILSSTGKTASVSLALGEGNQANPEKEGRLAELTMDLSPGKSTSARVVYSEFYGDALPLFQGKGMFGFEAQRRLDPRLTLTAGYGVSFDREMPDVGERVATVGLRHDKDGIALSLGLGNTSPSEARYGQNLYEATLGVGKIGTANLTGSFKLTSEYGPPRADRAPYNSSTGSISVGLGGHLDLRGEFSNSYSQDPLREEEDFSSSTLSLRWGRFHTGATYAMSLRRKEMVYPSTSKDSYVETEMELGWGRPVGDGRFELKVSRELTQFKSGELSGTVGAAVRGEIPLWEGAARLAPFLEIEESRYQGIPRHIATIGLEGKLALDYASTVSFGCKFSGGGAGTAFGFERFDKGEYTVSFTRKFNYLIPRATAKIRAVVFEDTDGDGAMGPSELGVPGIGLRLEGTASKTGKDGICEFRSLQAGTHVLSLDVASIPVTMGYLARDVKVTLRERETKDVYVALFRGGFVGGRINVEGEEESKKDLQGILIKAVPLGLKDGSAYERRAFVGSDGRFTLTGLYPGENLVSIELPGNLSERYEIVTGSLTPKVEPGETVSDVTFTLRAKVKPIVTTFIAERSPSLNIKVQPESIPCRAEPKVTVESSLDLAGVTVTLPTGKIFTLEGKGRKWAGHIELPEDAKPGPVQLTVTAVEPSGAKWTRRVPVVITESGELVTARLIPGTLYAGQKARLTVSSLVAMDEITVSLPWRDDMQVKPEDPYMWESDCPVPPDAAPGTYVVRVNVTTLRGASFDRELKLTIRE